MKEYTIAQAAKKLGLRRTQLQNAVIMGKIKSTVKGAPTGEKTLHYITEEELKRFADVPREEMKEKLKAPTFLMTPGKKSHDVSEEDRAYRNVRKRIEGMMEAKELGVSLEELGYE